MKNLKKVIKVLLNTLVTLIILISLVVLLLYAIGIRPFIVQSGSMETQIHVGSICFINERVKMEDVQIGDIIAFQIPGGMKVTHRVIGKTPEGLETKGDANEPSDGISTTKSNYLGKNVFCIPYIGYIARAFQTPIGIFISVMVGLIIVLLEVILEKTPEEEDEKNKRNNKQNNSDETKNEDELKNEFIKELNNEQTSEVNNKEIIHPITNEGEKNNITENKDTNINEEDK